MIIEKDITCPGCGKKMTKLELGNRVVDVCLDGCGGIWFDAYEINSFDEDSEELGQMLEDITPEKNIKKIPEDKRECPRCMMSHLEQQYFSNKQQVMMDRCPKCGGVFLDAGELKEIRKGDTAIKCTACQKPMKHVEVEGMVIDVCLDGCGGMWFDKYELKRVDNGCENVGELLNNLKAKPGIKTIPAEKRKCPRCQESILRQGYYSTRKEVIIDKCYNCGGVFLDAGELAHIRSLYYTAEDKQVEDAAFARQMTQDIGMVAEDKIPTPPLFKAYMGALDNFFGGGNSKSKMLEKAERKAQNR